MYGMTVTARTLELKARESWNVEANRTNVRSTRNKVHHIDIVLVPREWQVLVFAR